LVLVLAHDAQGTPLRLIVELAADDVAIQINKTADETRSFGTLVFEATRIAADRILAGTTIGLPLEIALANHAAIGIAADAAGGSEAVLDLTLEYLRTRQQFGRPIGSFQALKHRCANHKLAMVASSALLDEAVSVAASGGDARIEASAAKAYASDVYAAVASDAVQLHGGIGFTWEYVCHLYLKRAKLDQAMFGSSGFHFDRVAAALVERLAA
jgi:alkylation response protein AidB-like acyl-CoA dehydrogenase